MTWLILMAVEMLMSVVYNYQVVPLFQARQKFVFMHDNARPHTANSKKLIPATLIPKA